MAASRHDPPSVSQTKTLVESHNGARLDEDARCPCLTIIYHPDLRRVGEQAVLGALVVRDVEEVSRLVPRFAQPGASQGRSLRDPYLSRRPVLLRREVDAIEIVPDPGVLVEVDGEVIESPMRRVLLRDLDKGVLIQLARRVVLLLHQVTLRSERPPHWGLVGDSEAISGVRQQIERVADVDVPVLIRGETGVGKERVAASIHAASQRARLPMVAVNMAAIAPSTAVSELFGHARGAFTGAVTRHIGLFERANGSTLFLDEIGETPVNIQTMLLRTLAEGTIRPVGDRQDRAIDVRVLAATDADLEQAGEDGTFRTALLYRLAGYEIRIPPLRERRDDIPRLVFHFLKEELDELGEAWRLRPPETARKLWFPPALMVRLFDHAWPGNVRQLRNTVRQIVISSRGLDVARVDGNVERVLSEEAAPGARDEQASPGDAPAIRPRTRPLSNAEIFEALRACQWRIKPAADKLGIPRATLYDLIDKHPDLRRGPDISREEIEACYRECNGSLDRMVDRLRVSKRSLQLRMRILGMDYGKR